MKTYYEYYEYRPNRFVILKNRRVVGKANGKEINWEEFELNSVPQAYIESRPGYFIRLINGKAKGMASREELIWEGLDLEGYTNTRNVGILIGLTVLTWLVTVISADALSRYFFILGYICFSVLFFISYAAYLIPRMKLAGMEYIYRRKLEIDSEISYFRLTLWVFTSWFIRRLIGSKYPLDLKGNLQAELSTEFGYLLFYWIMTFFFGLFLPLLAYFLILQKSILF